MKAAVGGAFGASLRLGERPALHALPVSGCGGRGGARAGVREFGGRSGACEVTVGGSVSGVARPVELRGRRGPSGPRRRGAAGSAERPGGAGPRAELGERGQGRPEESRGGGGWSCAPGASGPAAGVSGEAPPEAPPVWGRGLPSRARTVARQGRREGLFWFLR